MSGPRANRQFWTNDREQGKTLGVVLDHPRRPGEGSVQYMERVAILAGLMPASRASFGPNRALAEGEPEPVGVLDSRLPYREREDFE